MVALEGNKGAAPLFPHESFVEVVQSYYGSLPKETLKPRKTNCGKYITALQQLVYQSLLSKAHDVWWRGGRKQNLQSYFLNSPI